MSSGYLSAEDYERVRGQVPIACIDALPYRYKDSLEVGLIQRRVPTTDGAWTSGWALLGGRVYRGETLAVALARHIETTLGTEVRWNRDIDWHRPVAVGQYFPQPVPGTSFDPRQHTIAVTFAVALEGLPQPQGEAEGFEWFTTEALPTADEIGFDQAPLIHAAISAVSSSR